MSQDFNDAARKWLEGDFDPETKMKVIELRNTDPAGFEDAFYKNLEFGPEVYVASWVLVPTG